MKAALDSQVQDPQTRLPLSAKPKWVVARIFQWLTVILTMLMVAILLGILWMQVAVDALNESQIDFNYDFNQLWFDSVFILPSIGLLWLISLVAEKLDDLVWLNCSRSDQDEILVRRKSKTARNER